MDNNLVIRLRTSTPRGVEFDDRTDAKKFGFRRRAFLADDSVVVEFEDDCPVGLRARITIKAAENIVSGRLFSGVYPCGIVYADRYVEVAGDYKRLAFLAYDTLALSIEKDCPADLRARIVADAATFQAKRGQRFGIDSSGSNSVVLGSALISQHEGRV
jgi:hypothetical protein